MKKILIVGQTPPPFGGQAIMIKTLLDGDYKQAKLFHVRMSFSKEMDELGKFKFSKIIHLLRTIISIAYFRVFRGVRVLYYPPSGPDIVPIFRDLAILCLTRWMFQKTIFHFHAAGISEIYPSLPKILKFLFNWGYDKPDIAIKLSEFNPDDGAMLNAKTHCVIPYGIVDEYLPFMNQPRNRHSTCTLLYVGLITESKGILVLVDAIRILFTNGLSIRANIVGKFESSEFEQVVLTRITELGMMELFNFSGVLTGVEKYRAYLAADIFCFPTYFESESFGLVVAEAMQFELPVVATRWRGVQSLVVDEVTGFVTPIQDSKATADRIKRLILDSDLRSKMGREGRQRFLKEYSIDKFYERMDYCFSLLTRTH